MADKVRVLQLTVGLGLGGAEKLMAHTAARLDRARFDVEVLALKSWGPCGEVLRAAGVPVRVLGGRGPADAAALLRARGALLGGCYDIVHAHLLWANLAACLWKGRSKVLWHEHDTDAWMKPHHRFLQRALIGRADAVAAVSGAVARGLAGRMPFLAGKIEALANPWIPPSAGTLGGGRPAVRGGLGASGAADLLIGYVGRLETRKKGLDVFLAAAARTAGRVPAARFVLVGGGADRVGLEASVGALGLKEKVLFAGERSDMGAVYGALDLLVLPSRWEGFGLVLLEAMAAGVPVVATSVGGIPEVVVHGETGLLVAPEDPDALAGAVEELLADAPRRERFGRTGRAAARERFGLDPYVRRVESLYRKILGGGAAIS